MSAKPEEIHVDQDTIDLLRHTAGQLGVSINFALQRAVMLLARTHPFDNEGYLEMLQQGKVFRLGLQSGLLKPHPRYPKEAKP